MAKEDDKKTGTAVASEPKTADAKPLFTRNKKLNERYEIVEDRHIVNIHFSHDGLVSEIRDEKQVMVMIAKGSKYVKEKVK